MGWRQNMGRQSTILATLTACLLATGCEQMHLSQWNDLLPGASPQPAAKPPEAPPPAPVASAPPPPAPVVVAPPPPAAPPKVLSARTRHRPLTDTEELMGLASTQVVTRLGQPNLKRFDKPDQIWQYRAGVCLLELRLHPDGNQTKVAQSALRPEPGQTVTDQDCLIALNDALHLT